MGDAHLHVRPEGHGVRHGGVLFALGGESRRRLEGLREGDEEGRPLPRRGVLISAGGRDTGLALREAQSSPLDSAGTTQFFFRTRVHTAYASFSLFVGAGDPRFPAIPYSDRCW